MPRRSRSPKCRAIPVALIALLPMLLTTACGQPVGKPLLVQRDPPGPDLTDCADEPPMPETFADEASRYAWSARAIFAGRDCRARLAALKAWAINAPQP